MKHSLSMINYLSMNYLPIFSRWLWKYVVYIINISLLAQIIGSHFWWYLCSIFSFQPTKYSLSATDRIRNPPTLLRIIRKSLFFFQQWMHTGPWNKSNLLKEMPTRISEYHIKKTKILYNTTSMNWWHGNIVYFSRISILKICIRQLNFSIES